VQLVADLLGLDRWDLERWLPGFVTSVDHSRGADLDRSAGAWFQVGRPLLALLAIGPTGVTLAVPRVEWQGPADPVLRSEDQRHVPFGDLLADLVPVHLDEVVRIRRSRFHTCVDCEQDKPPEWMEGDLCHSCMERNHGVVF